MCQSHGIGDPDEPVEGSTISRKAICILILSLPISSISTLYSIVACVALPSYKTYGVYMNPQMGDVTGTL